MKPIMDDISREIAATTLYFAGHDAQMILDTLTLMGGTTKKGKSFAINSINMWIAVLQREERSGKTQAQIMQRVTHGEIGYGRK